MLTRKHSIEGKHPFGKAAELFNTLDADAAMKLAMVAGDVTLVLDDTGTILDAAFDPREITGQPEMMHADSRWGLAVQLG